MKQQRCKKLIEILACVICLSPFVRAQELPATPPKDVIRAATTAFREYDNGQTFKDILALPQVASKGVAGNPITIEREFNTQIHMGVVGAPSFPSPHIVRLVSESDFVGIGVPLTSWSYPTAGQSFAITIYLVKITEVTVSGPEKIAVGSTIYVARAGGDVEFEGKHFRAVETDFPLLVLNDTYLFFGKEVGASTYKVDAPRTLKVQGNSVSEVSRANRLGEYYKHQSLASILEEAFQAWKQSTSSSPVHP